MKLNFVCVFIPETLKYWVGVHQGQSYLMGGASLVLVGHPSSDGITIKNLIG